VTPHYEGQGVTLWHGDCLDVLATLPDSSVDAVCTDPPYGLGFMGQKWDTYANEVGRAKPANAQFDHVGGNHNPTSSADAARTRRVEGKRFGEWCEQWAAQCLRVLKPGGHLLAFGGSRTHHRLTSGVEDAGFEIRDCITWHFASGFPKSLDVSKAIDRAAGAERDVVGERSYADGHVQRSTAPRFNGTDYANGEVYVEPNVRTLTAPATDAARQWAGWGTALKPATEFIVVARKPLTGTVAANVQTWGTGALNIDASRIHTPGSEAKAYTVKRMKPGATLEKTGGNWRPDDDTDLPWEAGREYEGQTTAGRWPANVIFDETQAAHLDEQSGERPSGANPTRRGSDKFRDAYGDFQGQEECEPARGADTGGASRFFFVAKADASERPRTNGVPHPTVKPLALMRHLVRLVTPPGGTVLEPFAGSGTTVEACLLEGFRCIAIEKTDEYLPLVLARIHRQRDPVQAIKLAGEPLGLFDFGTEETA
jgi:site-specific DNA-methyltransferase (adenine-specific)